MKGYLSRFHTDTPQPFFVQRALQGPQTSVPHWEICRPDIRRDLAKGDMVFYFSEGETTTGWSNFACRAVLVVDAKVTEVDGEHVLGPRWRRWHRRQRCAHHKSDRYNRANDVILGDRNRSLWVERGIDLRRSEFDHLRKADKLGLKRNKWMDKKDCTNLYARLWTLAP